MIRGESHPAHGGTNRLEESACIPVVSRRGTETSYASRPEPIEGMHPDLPDVLRDHRGEGDLQVVRLRPHLEGEGDPSARERVIGANRSLFEDRWTQVGQVTVEEIEV